tara:strand:- start:102 stop:860 length:759 start_codon:yes stop_codon:yes gene_type:complete
MRGISMSQEMKLIMENWRESQLLLELDQDAPVTWEQFRGLLKAMIGAKQGLVGGALAKFAGLTNLFGSKTGTASDATEIIDFITGIVAENKKNEEAVLITEIVVLGTVLLGLKALAAIGTARTAVGFIGKIAKRLKGQPTDATDKNPFLDLLNLDPKYSAILDNRLEEEFLKWWLAKIDGLQGDMDDADLDINSKMQEFIKEKYQRGLGEPPAHDPPSTIAQRMKLGTAGAVQRTQSKAKMTGAGRLIGLKQ